MNAASVPGKRIEAIRAFNRFYTQKIGALGAGHLDTEYTLTEARVLYELAHAQNALASDIAQSLALDAGYLSRILARFEQRGLVTRVRSQLDARKAFIRLTARGRRTFAALNERAQAEVRELLAPLPPARQAELQKSLEAAMSLLGAPAQTGEVTLREHRPGDMGWIIQMHGVEYAREYGWNQEFEALVAEICAKFLRNQDPMRERCWIAERNGAPVGCIMLVKHSSTVAKLRLLLVCSSERGRGVGHMLVDECLRFARAAGYRKVTLWTQSILTSARRIYEAKGFRLLESTPHESFGAKLVGETWELDLRSAGRTSLKVSRRERKDREGVKGQRADGGGTN